MVRGYRCAEAKKVSCAAIMTHLQRSLHFTRTWLARVDTLSFSRNELKMRRFFVTLLMLSVLAVTSGCVYQATLSQGNLLKQEDLEQVEAGMTRNQVRFLLGTPMVNDLFHRDRWDYVYYLRIGRQDPSFTRWVSIYFDDDAVSQIVKDQELKPDV